MAKTLKDWYKLSIDIQSACNLIAVSRSFNEAMTELRALGVSRDELDTHPVIVLLASKIASLTCCEDTLTFAKAYDEACEESK